MPKELPYFKFTVAEWLTGDIVYEPFGVQGLFINICAIYWQREGKLSINDINKRFKDPHELNELTDRFISVINGFISIKFLDEQFEQRKSLCNTNSKNGSLGGRPKSLSTKENKPNANRTLTEPKAKQTNIEKRREEKNKIIPKKLFFKDSEIFDHFKFKEVFPDWEKDQLRYYWDAADRYSSENHKYLDWGKAIRNWAKKDELEGKIKFKINNVQSLDQPAN